MAIKTNISLKKYKWTRRNKISIVGWVWHEKEYLEGDDFVRLIANISNTLQDFQASLKLLNGQFSILIEKENYAWLASSHTWDFPLFYSNYKNEWRISDLPEFAADRFEEVKWDSFAKEYFLQFGVTPGKKTLMEGVNQVQPNELVVLENRKAETFCIEGLNTGHESKTNKTTLQKTIESVFKKYSVNLKDKPILLPLTAGYDSRLLACLLKQAGHTNVICATWGRKGNHEARVAAKVAEVLGFKHVFVEYNADLISGFVKNEEFAVYANYAGHASSMPFLQDYFAVKFLIENGLVSKSTIVLPGHSGDFFAGSHLEIEMKSAPKNYLIKRVFEKYGSQLYLNSQTGILLKNEISRSFFDNKLPGWRNFEKWDLKDRQGKFICNSNQVYSFFGLQTMMPLFDKDFISFFKDVSFEQRINTGLYNTTLEDQYFRPMRVDINLKNQKLKKRKLARLKTPLIGILPYFLKQLYYPTNDSIFYHEMTNELMQSSPEIKFKKPKLPHKYNAYIIQWYLNFLKQNINSH